MIRFLKYLSYARYSIFFLLLLLTVNIMLSIGVLFVPAMNKILFDKLLLTFDGYLLLKYLIISLLLLGYNIILSFVFSIINTVVLFKISNKLKVTFLKRLLHSKYDFFLQNDTGFLVKRLVEDSSDIGDGISNLIQAGCNLIKIITVGFILGVIGTWLLKMYVILILGSLIWTIAWSVPCVWSSNKIGNSYSDIYTYYWEVIPGIKTIKLHNYYSYIIEKMNSIQMTLNENRMLNCFFNSILWQISHVFPWLGYAAILYVGIFKVEQGELTIGTLMGLFSMIWIFYVPLQALFTNISIIQTGISASLRTKIIHNAPKEKSGKIKFEGIKKAIEFKNVNFSYDNKKMILENLNLKIDKNEKVCLRGKSGSGKTTIVHLLLGLFDKYTGEILLDGTELKQYDINSIRRNIAFISQDIYLFNDTLRKNIDINNSLTDEQLMSILDELNMSEKVMGLRNGLDTKYGEDGFDLSGGEKQRISIARCLALKTSIIITDEITSSLDPKTDKKVKMYLKEIKKDATLIGINHRESYDSEYDREIELSA